MILPWITIAAVSAATYTRLTRGSLLDVLGEDYIRTARSKGLSERRVVYRHGVRSALTPVVSQLGVDIGTLAGGAVVTETVFGLGGIGQASVTAILNGDARRPRRRPHGRPVRRRRQPHRRHPLLRPRPPRQTRLTWDPKRWNR
jgi:ABC-type antimicrobial peptide transport system permease subunit